MERSSGKFSFVAFALTTNSPGVSHAGTVSVPLGDPGTSSPFAR